MPSLQIEPGDKVRLKQGYGIGNRSTGIVERINGHYIYVLIYPNGYPYPVAVESYPCEVKEVISKGNDIPLSKAKLDQLIGLAAVETVERMIQREEAIKELKRLALAGQIVWEELSWPPVLA